MKERTRNRLALGAVWLLPLLWAVNYVIARKAPGVITAHVLALGRWGLAGLILATVARKELWLHRVYLWRNAWRYCVLGGCGMWICGAWVYLAGQSTGAMNISLIYASAPVMIALGSVLWLHEHLTLRQSVGVVLALCGVVHVVVQGEWLRLSQVQLVPGDLWIAAAAIAWAAYALLQKHWPGPLGSTAQLAAIAGGGVLVLLPFALWELLPGDTPVLGTQALVLVVSAALLPGVVAYWIYGWAQKVLGASRVAVTLYMGPLYAALVSWQLLDEPLGWHHASGGALILVGVALVVVKKE